MLLGLREEGAGLFWGASKGGVGPMVQTTEIWTKFVCLLGCQLSCLYSDLGNLQ